MELLLTNRVLDAEEALDGLVNRIVDDDKLDETAAALAARLASGPTGAYGGVKRLLGDAEPGLEGQLGRESRSIAAAERPRRGAKGSRLFSKNARRLLAGRDFSRLM